MLPGVENLSGIRTFRVLRALRTISAVKGKFRLRLSYRRNELPCFFVCLSNFVVEGLLFNALSSCKSPLTELCVELKRN